MARKPGSMYRYVRGKPSTRKEYMGGIPVPRISQFVLGNKTGDFPVQVTLHALEKCNVRHTALESARITVNRAMEKKVGINNYRIPFFDIKRKLESTSLIETTYEYDDMILETYYKGYIGEKFVCALKVVKADF